jgi:hypothetical protein
MRKIPGWYTDEVSRHAKLIDAGEESRDSALVSMRTLIRDDHREFGNSVLDDFNAPELDARVASLKPAPDRPRVAPEPERELHATLFSDVPYRIRVTPGKLRTVKLMSPHELDMARKVWQTQAKNSIDGSQAWLDAHEAFYAKVRPLMGDDDTVADVEARLAAGVRVRQ